VRTRESTKFPLAPLPPSLSPLPKEKEGMKHPLSVLLLFLSVANVINNFMVLQKTASTHAINDAKKM